MNYKRLFITNSFVFITIVTAKRRNILIDNIDILREAFNRTITSYGYKIFAICVLPDHVHMIIKPNNINDYPKIIQQLKRYFSQHIDKNTIPDYSLTKGNIKRKECDIWQHKYWEHTIRDENDLNTHTDYIHYNPCKHGYVQNVIDWEYSSFKEFVNKNLYDINWCNFNDINKITNLDFE